MRILLDTHIWIWSLTEPARLKPKVRAALAHRNAGLWLSGGMRAARIFYDRIDFSDGTYP